MDMGESLPLKVGMKLSHEENDFVCKRTLEQDRYSHKPKYEGCKECCLHCTEKSTCEKACALVESSLKDCSEAISKKGYCMGELFEKK